MRRNPDTSRRFHGLSKNPTSVFPLSTWLARVQTFCLIISRFVALRRGPAETITAFISFANRDEVQPGKTRDRQGIDSKVC